MRHRALAARPRRRVGAAALAAATGSRQRVGAAALASALRALSRHSASALCALALVACVPGQSLTAAAPTAPVLDALPTTPLRATSVALTGSRAAHSAVWVRFASGSEALLAAAAADVHWSATLALDEGANTFTLAAVQGAPLTADAPRYTVVRDTTAPAPPVADAPDGVYLDGAPSVTYVLQGSRDADGDLQLGGTQVLPASGDTTWSLPVTVAYGDTNAVRLRSADALGNQSAEVVVALFGTSLPAPTLVADVVDGAAQLRTLSGSKPAGTDLSLQLDDAAPQALGLHDATTWSAPIWLSAAGTHRASAWVTQAAQRYRSPSATAALTLQAGLSAPTGLSPDLTAPLPDTAADHLVLSGTGVAGTQLCVSSVSHGPCDLAQATPAASGTFSVSVPLHSAATDALAGGQNAFYVSSRDAAGATSVEQTGRIYRVAAPIIAAVTPNPGTVWTGSTLAAAVVASPHPADARPSAAIDPATGVHICLDALPCVAAALSSGAYRVPAFDLSQMANGSAHTLRVTVQDAVGAQATQTLQYVYSTGVPVWLSSEHAAQPATAPQVVVDGAGTVHAVWQDYCAQAGTSGCSVALGAGQQPPDIFYARRPAGGGWSAIVNVSPPAGDGISQAPVIAIDAAGNVHIVWSESGTLNIKPQGAGIVRRVLAAPSFAPGAVDAVASTAGVDDVAPSLAIDPHTGDVHVAFTRHVSAGRYDIMYAHAMGTGAFSAPIVTSGGAATVQADRASIAATAGGHAAIAYQVCNSDPNAQVGRCTDAPDASAVTDHDVMLREVIGTPPALGYGPLLVSDQSKPIGYDGDSLQPALLSDPNAQLWLFWADTSRLHGQSARSIWLRRYVPGSGGGSGLQPYTLISPASSQGGLTAAEQPVGAIAPTQGGDAAIVVTWTQGLSGGGSDIWACQSALSRIFAVQTSADLPSALATTPGASLAASTAYAPDSSRITVWVDSSTYGAAVNAEGLEQIFAQVDPPAP